ncbi:MAG: PAS domain-containing sensor histidine kinase [Anaerolineae bacterium]
MPVLIIYALQLILLISLILSLHWLSATIGLLPMLFVVMTLVVLTALSTLLNAIINVTPNIRLGIVGDIFVPLIISSMLILYIINGVSITRTTFIGLVIVNLLVIVLVGFFLYYARSGSESVTALPGISTTDISFISLVRNRVASLAGFSVSIMSIIIIYQAMHNILRDVPEFLVIASALIVSVLLDHLIFFTISDIGLVTFINTLSIELLTIFIVGVALSLPITLYVQANLRAKRLIQPLYGRPIFGILFGAQAQRDSGFHEMQSQLYVSQQIDRYLMNNLDAIIYLLDAKTNDFLYISPAFERLTGYPPSILENKLENVNKIIHPDDQLKTGMMEFVLKHPTNTYRYIRADGTEGWMKNRLQPIMEPDGTIYQYLGVTEDISKEYERREHELQLTLTQERVRIINEFIRETVHDLKTPLSAIVLKIDMLQRTQGERHQQLQVELRERAYYLSNLIDDLFTLTMFEGSVRPEPEVVDLLSIVQDVVNDLDAIAQRKAINVTVEADEVIQPISGNANALTRLTNNLVSNAIRYTETGSVTVQVHNDNQHVVMQVIDTGIGIAQDEMSEIFDRYYRAPIARKLVKDGTGLGLAISRAIAEHHDGEITVSSQPDVGTTFTVRLPHIQPQQVR